MQTNWRFTHWVGSVFAQTNGSSRIGGGENIQPAIKAILRRGTLSFTAHGSMGAFVGSTITAAGMVEGDITSARGWVEAPVAMLTTRNALRDRDMRAALEAAIHPVMRFDLIRVEVLSDDTVGDTFVVGLHGTLTIRGVKRVVYLPATVAIDTHAIRVEAAFPLDLEAYRIGNLSRMFGLLRLKREIEVRLDLQFTRLRANDPLRNDPLRIE